MLNFPLAPGVHIDDTTRSALSVTNMAPGLPVMIVGLKGPWLTLNQPYLVSSFAEIERWLQGTSGVRSGAAGFASARASRRGGNPAHQRLSSLNPGPENQSSSEPDWSDPSFSALKAFFDNGGGDCYLCRSDRLSQIADLPDATLVIQAGQPVEVGLAIAALCQPGSGLFALLDGPNDAQSTDEEETVPRQPRFDSQKLEAFLSAYNPSGSAALYYPWLSPHWRLYQRNGEPVTAIHPVAPSAVAAALFQQTDRQTGPWKAPSNLTLQPGLTPLVKVGDASQALFNQDGKLAVNMLREFPGIGVQLWGARTLSAGDLAWTYVPVRRTFDRIERDMQQSLRNVLFKPNGPQTWQQLRNAAESYLFGLFEAGAFAGTTPEQSYQVQVGVGSSMTRQDLNDGILRMNIGLAVVRPAEFIVLEFSQIMASAVSGDVVTPIREPLTQPSILHKKKFILAVSQIKEWSKSLSGVVVNMGGSLALAGNGKYLIVSGTSSAKNVAHYIYELKDNGWASDFGRSESNYLGRSFAVSYYGERYALGVTLRSSSADGTLFIANSEGNIRFAKDSTEPYKNVRIPSLGYSVATNFNGDVVATGAPTAKFGNVSSGSAFISFYSEGRWSEIEDNTINLGNEGKVNDRFGESVLLNKSGDRLIVSATHRDECGAVFTWSHINDSWVRDDKILTNAAVSSNFGQSLAINGDCTLLAVSAPDYNDGKGAVYLYKLGGEGWESESVIIPNEVNIKSFGHKIKLSSDGEILVISCRVEQDVGVKSVGCVALYQRFDGGYFLTQKVFSEESAIDYRFGEAIDLSYDGNLLVVGEPDFPMPNAIDGSQQSGRVNFYNLVDQNP